MQNNQALAVPSNDTASIAHPDRAFEARSFGEAMQIATVLHESAMFRKLPSPAAIFAVLATGRELGLTGMQSLRGLFYESGKIGMFADTMVALVKRSSVCEYFEARESTDDKCTIETKRRGSAKPTSITWTIEMAKRADLLKKDNWKAYPASMLYARAAAALARRVYPEILLGLYAPDEVSVEVQVEAEIQAPTALAQAPAAAAPASPIPEAQIDEEPPPNLLEMLLGRYRARLGKCNTAAEIDAVSSDATKENLDTEARAKMLDLFREHRARIAAPAPGAA